MRRENHLEEKRMTSEKQELCTYNNKRYEQKMRNTSEKKELLLKIEIEWKEGRITYKRGNY